MIASCANFASEVLGEIDGNEGNFDDGLWVQEVINAVEIPRYERRRVTLPLDGDPRADGAGHDDGTESDPAAEGLV